MWFTSSPKKGAGTNPRQSIGEETSNSILGNTANSSLEAGRNAVRPQKANEPPRSHSVSHCTLVSFKGLISSPSSRECGLLKGGVVMRGALRKSGPEASGIAQQLPQTKTALNHEYSSCHLFGCILVKQALRNVDAMHFSRQLDLKNTPWRDAPRFLPMLNGGFIVMTQLAAHFRHSTKQRYDFFDFAHIQYIR